MKTLTNVDDVRKALKSTKPVILFFYLDGCPHCETMAPLFDQLEKEMPSTECIKVESGNVPPELGISGFPKFVKVSAGKQVATADGEMSKDDLSSKLKSGGRRRPTRRRNTRRKRHASSRR